MPGLHEVSGGMFDFPSIPPLSVHSAKMRKLGVGRCRALSEATGGGIGIQTSSSLAQSGAL